MKQLAAAQGRVLTHRLEHNKETDRWVCACGYMLGCGGHEALYAPCPLFPPRPEPSFFEPWPKRRGKRCSRNPHGAASTLHER
jgi:hypothetical protein